MTASTDETPPFLKVLLSANAHGPVLQAIIEKLGDGAVEEFANAVRILDRRVSGELRTIEAISNEETLEPKKKKDRANARKQLELIVRGMIRQTARSITGTKLAQKQHLPWRTALAAAAMDIIRAHGAVDVLHKWAVHMQANSAAAREKAQKRNAETYGTRNQAILAEANAYSFKKQRGQAKTAAIHLTRKKNINVTTDAARGVIRRSKPK